MARLRLTLALLKPDLYIRPYAAKDVRELIVREGFYIVHREVIRMGLSRARLFYQEYQSKFFYERLVNYMSMGDMEALLLAHPNAIERWRELMGPTKPALAHSLAPRSIRSLHGLTDTRNSVHGSDCEMSLRKDTGILLPHFSIDDWYRHQEPLYRTGQVNFSEDSGTHRPLALTPDLEQQSRLMFIHS